MIAVPGTLCGREGQGRPATIPQSDFKSLAQCLRGILFKTVPDIKSAEFAFASDPATVQVGRKLLHDADRRKNSQLVQVNLLHGADSFQRD